MRDWSGEKIIRAAMCLLLLALAGGCLWHYLAISNDEMPCMDFWLDFEQIAKKVYEGGFALSDFFPVPHPLHWSALALPVNALFISAYKCNNLAYAYWGMAFCLICVACVLAWCHRHVRTGFWPLDFALFGCVVLPMVNLNQWEILDLYCSTLFMMRVLAFLLCFFLVDRFMIRSCASERAFWRAAIGCGLLCALACVGLAAAYYPGFVAAIAATVVLGALIRREPMGDVKRRAAFLAILVGTALAMILTTSGNPGASDATSAGADYVRGFLVMLASTVIPQSSNTGSYAKYYVVGAVILAAALVSVWQFFKYKHYRESWLPLMLLLYAGASIVVITYGRADSYGFDTLTSSRYVVETTLGLTGVAMIQARSIARHLREKKKGGVLRALACAAIALCMTALVLHADRTELRIGPYRKAYNQQMIQLALDIDDASDEELAIFQAPAENVRSGIATMKKYRLGLWNARSAYYARAIQSEAPLADG